MVPFGGWSLGGAQCAGGAALRSREDMGLAAKDLRGGPLGYLALLTVECAHQSVKIDVPFQRVWGRAWDSAFPASSQGMLGASGPQTAL